MNVITVRIVNDTQTTYSSYQKWKLWKNEKLQKLEITWSSTFFVIIWRQLQYLIYFVAKITRTMRSKSYLSDQQSKSAFVFVPLGPWKFVVQQHIIGKPISLQNIEFSPDATIHYKNHESVYILTSVASHHQ